GKSRLVRELLLHAQLDGALVAEIGGGTGANGGGTYRPIASLIGQLSGAVKEMVAIGPEHAVELARLVPELRLAPTPLTLGEAHAATSADESLDSKASRSRLTEAVIALIGAATGGRPVLLIVEDAHELDDASAQLLAALASRMRQGEMRGLLLL